MRISDVHAQMREDIRNLGPKVERSSGIRRLHNRGVRAMWRAIRADEADERNELTQHERTKAHRLGRCHK
jgi:hypothetical protein